jgi:uncharacterized protein
MTEPARILDLAGLRMGPGEGRRLDLVVALDDVQLSEQGYAPDPVLPPVRLDVSRMNGGGYALQLRFDSSLVGPCMRCLTPTVAPIAVDVRELEQKPGRNPAPEDAQLDSAYVDGDDLDVHRWANDSFVFSLPTRVLCREDCKGLCPECGADLNADPTHRHEAAPDPRMAALGGIRFDEHGNLVQDG